MDLQGDARLLDDQQRYILESFQRILSPSIPEAEQIAFLRQNDWNLELALVQYFQLYPQEADRNFQYQINRSRASSSTNNQPDTMSTNNDNGNGPSFAQRLSSYLRPSYRPLAIDEEQNPTQNMPGAFVESPNESTLEGNTTAHRDDDATVDENASSNVRLARSLLDNVLVNLFVPLYAIFLILQLGLLFFVEKLPPKFYKHGKKTGKRGSNPIDVAREFIYNFDKKIGNDNSHQDDDDHIMHLGSTSGDGDLGYHDNNTSNDVANDNIETDFLIPSNEHLIVPRPDFLECSYSQAMYFTKKDMRWLVVYINSDEHEDSNRFIEEIMIHKKFLSYIKEKDFLIWGGDIVNSESYQICNVHNITKLPFLGLLCLTVKSTPTSNGFIQSSPVLSIVAKLQGFRPKVYDQNGVETVDQVLALFDKAYTKFNPTLVRLKQEREADNMNREIRRQQDEAYNVGLQRDRERELERQRQLERERQELQEIQELQHKKETWLKWKKSQLNNIFEGTSDDYSRDLVRIAIRLNDGRRVTNKFPKDCTTEDIYAYVECFELNQVEVGDVNNFEEPENYVHAFKFKLYQLLPRELLECSKETEISQNPIVYPNGNLIVELDE